MGRNRDRVWGRSKGRGRDGGIVGSISGQGHHLLGRDRGSICRGRYKGNITG